MNVIVSGRLRWSVMAAAVALTALLAAATPSAVAAEALSARDQLWARSALKAAAVSNWSMATRFSKRISHPLAKKVIRWAVLSGLSPSATFEDLDTFISENPEWPRQKRLRRRAEELMNKDMPAAKIMDWFKTYPPLSGEGMERLAEALLSEGMAEPGRAMLRRAWREGNFTKARERAFYRRHRKMLTREDHIQRLDRLSWAGKYWPIRRMLPKVSKGQQALAMARISLRRRTGNVDTLIARVPKELKDHPGLIYERLRWRRRKGKESAYDILKDPPKDLGRPDLWWKERATLARRALGKGRVTDAYAIVKDHRLSEGAPFADAEWMAGWIALRFLNDNAEAKQHFERMHAAVKFPISRARGAYWMGRAEEASGNGEEAKSWYKKAGKHWNTYYGQLAALRLNGEETISVPENPEVNKLTEETFDAHELVSVVRLLGTIKAEDHMRHFVYRLQEISPEPGWQVLTARLARYNGRPDLSVLAAKRAGRQGSPLPRLAYPTIKPPKMHRKAAAPRPEQPLTLAVIRQESAFRIDARSRANAMGLMQLIPPTAKRVARRLGLKYTRARLMSDADYNMTLGQAYLGGVLKDFDNSYVLALAAYNAGPARSKRWIRNNGDPRQKDVDAVDWIELIPFDETRNYVQRVLENLQVYRARLADTEVALALEKDLHN